MPNPTPPPRPNAPVSSTVSLHRRHLLAQALCAAGWLSLPRATWAAPSAALWVNNVTRLYAVEVARIEAPRSTAEVVAAVQAWPGRVAVGGGRYSMGGQVAVSGGLHLDMRAMNQLVWLRPEARQVRVQAGMRWRDLQDVIDPHGLAVKTMQSYANFTVGGSVSVNVHGRYVGHGPIANTVLALQLVLADGRVVEASPTQRSDLFRAALGGYGALGVITEVELALADNLRIERVVQPVPLSDYVAYFEREVRADPASVLHNADLLPPHFDAPVAVTWRRTEQPLTVPQRLVPRGQRYALERQALWAITELPGGERLRSGVLQPLLLRGPVVQWLNHEASLDVAELEPRSRRSSTYVLQEYFVPPSAFVPFAQGLAQVLQRHHVAALNVSIRHAPADTVTLLPWAQGEVFCFVLYYKQRTHAQAQAEVGRWTQALIDLALAHGGRYYLPYQLHATPAQFAQAYPGVEAWRAVKTQWDPAGKFSNSLWARYG